MEFNGGNVYQVYDIPDRETGEKLLNVSHQRWRFSLSQFHSDFRSDDPLFPLAQMSPADEYYAKYPGGILHQSIVMGTAAMSVLKASLERSTQHLVMLQTTQRRDAIHGIVSNAYVETCYGKVMFDDWGQNIGREDLIIQYFPTFVNGSAGLENLIVAPNVFATGPVVEPVPNIEARFGCQPGRFSPDGLSCEDCPPGHEQPNQIPGEVDMPTNGGQPVRMKPTTCQLCPEGRGTLENETGTVNCPVCSAGRYREGAKIFSFSQSKVSDDGFCLPCDPGHFRAEDDSSSQCNECEPGTYQENALSTSCNLCPPGRMQASWGGVICTLCDPGFFSSESGSSACAMCEFGSVTSQPGGVNCTLCPPGKASSNAVTCETCLRGSWSNEGSSVCTSCSFGESSDPGSGSLEDCYCIPGHGKHLLIYFLIIVCILENCVA